MSSSPLIDYLDYLVADSSCYLEVDPQNVLNISSNDFTEIHEGYGREEERISFSSDKKYFINLRFSLLSETDANYIFDFFNDKDKANGQTNSFYYQPNNSWDDVNTYVVRFGIPNLNMFFRNIQIYGFSDIILVVLGKKYI